VLSSQPKSTWTLILGSGMISLLEPRNSRAGMKDFRKDLLRGQLWTWSLRGSCAKLARIWAETFSFLARLSFFMFFFNQTVDRNTGGDLNIPIYTINVVNPKAINNLWWLNDVKCISVGWNPY
jgi:hypothetical protein